MKPSALSLAIAQLLGTVAVSAGEIVVDSTSDRTTNNGDCTLREAVVAANTDRTRDGCAAGDGTDRIVFDIPLPATLTLNTSLVLQSNLIIDGPGRDRLMIDADGNRGIVNDSGSMVEIRDLSISNANLGAIFNDGSATISNVSVTDSMSSGRGGGVDNRGDMTLSNVTLSGNRADGGGGGVHSSGSLRAEDSLFEYNDANYGGGIFSNGLLELVDSVVRGNRVALDGGGVLAIGDTVISGSRLTGNDAGAGGGIFQSGGTLDVEGSSIDNNDADFSGGGGYFRGAEVNVDQSTISGNNAERSGGGVYADSGSMSLMSSTVHNNVAPTGSGLQRRGGNLGIQTSVLSGNTGADCNDPADLFSGNFSDGGECDPDGKANLPKGDGPVLTGLMNRNGPPVHVPAAGGPLVDALSNSSCAATDQSGRPRPFDFDGRGGSRNCDIGAAERQAEEFAVDFGVSGLWFNTRRAGEGFLIDHLPDNRANIFFFTYDASGNPMWLIGDARIQENQLVVDDVLVATGASFGNAFDPADVNLTSWGSLSFDFLDCNSAHVRYQSNDFGSGNIALSRLSSLAGVACDPVFTGKVIQNGHSGAFFDPNRAGEGIQIQMVSSNGSLVPVVYWFTYDNDGNQLWLLGVGRVEGDSIVIDTVQNFGGAVFGDAFDPDTVAAENWGSLRLDFSDCDNVQLMYSAANAAFGSGQLSLTRLYQTAGTQCN